MAVYRSRWCDWIMSEAEEYNRKKWRKPDNQAAITPQRSQREVTKVNYPSRLQLDLNRITALPRTTPEECVERIIAALTPQTKETDMTDYKYYHDQQQLIQAVTSRDKAYLLPVINHWCDLVKIEGNLRYPVLLGLAIYGEARGEGVIGQIAVGEVVLNRYVRRKALYLEDVLLAPNQFSCFNRSDRSLVGAEKLPRDDVITWCNFSRLLIDCVDKQGKRALPRDTTLYCTEAAFKRIALAWAVEQKGAWDLTKLKRRGRIERHIFFAE